MAIGSYANALGAAQQLVPDWAQEELRRKLGTLQTRSLAIQQRQAEQEIAQNDQVMARQRAFYDRIAQHGANPKATDQDLYGIAAAYPEFAQPILRGAEAMTEERRRQVAGVTGQIDAALTANRPDLATKLLEREVAADKAAGREVEPADQAMLDALKSGDPKEIAAARTIARTMFAVASNPEQAAKIIAENGADGSYTLSAGQKRFNAAGEVIAEAPFAPRDVPIYDTEGRRVGTQLNVPKGGDPSSSGLSPDAVFDALIRQESGGRPGVLGPPTQYGRAEGMTQMLPDTARAMAGKINMPWMPERMRDTSPEGAEYQRTLGRAYFEEGLKKYDGDLEKALMYYHGGPDEALWGPKTRAYAKAVMARAGKGEGAQTGSVGPVASQGAKPARMTAAEVAAEGLDPNTVYYRGKDGVPQAVSGQAKASATSKPVPPAVEKDVNPQVGIRDTLDRLTRTFRPDYSGVGSRIENVMQGVIGGGTPGQLDWWADFYTMDNAVRNELFGATLTDNEQAAYEKTTITPRMSAAEIKKNLGRRQTIIKGALARRQRFLKANGYNSEAVDELFSGSAGAPASATPGGFRILRVRPK